MSPVGSPASPAISPTSSPAVSDAQALADAVRAYSAAFLSGQAKTAWLMRTPAARSDMTYAEFFVGVSQAKQIYGDAKMTSLKIVSIFEDEATVTYTYDISDINQTNQHWVKQGGIWLVDN
jgi:hypothetical protein